MNAEETRTAPGMGGIIPHLLIVDDNKLVRELISNHLSDFGYTFSIAENGKQALQRLAEEKYDILLTDLKMPEMDGWSLIGMVSKQYPDMICIVMSVNTEIEKTISALSEHKSFDYLLKPFNEKTLKKTIDKAFELQTLRRKAAAFSESEKLLYENFMSTFDWKKELRSKHTESVAHNLIKQLNIGLFHGGGFGTLLSLLSLMTSCAAFNEEKKVYEIPEDIFALIKENSEMALNLSQCLSKAQNILPVSKECSETIFIRDMFPLIEAFSEEVGGMLAIKGQRLSIGSLPSIPPRSSILFDREKMRMAFKEIFVNAMKYSRERDAIYVLFFLRENYFEVKVLNPAYPNEDGTLGIQGKNEILVFEPFYRLSSLMDDRYAAEEFGHGLGLTVVKKIVDLHRAGILIYTVKSHVGGAAESHVCVTIRFPVI